jgi:hypothetical protein
MIDGEEAAMKKRDLLLMAVFAAACSGTNAPETTERFSGTLQPQSLSWHPVVVEASGTMDLTVESLSPAAAVGIGIGHDPTSGCSLDALNASAGVGTLLSRGLTAGSYCVAIYDPGSLAGPTTYTLKVVHP